MKINYYVEYDKEENMYFIHRRFPNEIKLPLRFVCDKLNSQSDLIEDLERQLALTEKALELACEEYSKLYCEHYCHREPCEECENGDYKFFKDSFLEQAKEMMKSE